MDSKSDKCNCRITIRVTERMRQDIDNYAHERWQTLSRWVTDAIAAYAERCRMEDCN